MGTAEEDDILVKLVDSKAMQVRVYVGFLGGFSVFFGFFFSAQRRPVDHHNDEGERGEDPIEARASCLFAFFL